MCSTGKCGKMPYKWDHEDNTSYPLGDFVLVYKLPRSVPDRLRNKNLDLAYDPCYKSYRLIKRRVDDDDDNTTRYIKPCNDYIICTCKDDCAKTICVCVKCRDMKRICRRKKYHDKVVKNHHHNKSSCTSCHYDSD